MIVLRKLVFSFLIFPLAVAAQDTTVHVVPDVSPVSPVSGVLHMQRTLVFIDITNNFWLNKPDDIKTKFVSGGFNFNIAYEIKLVKNIFTFAPGIAFSNATVKNNTYPYYNFDNNNNVDSTSFIPLADSAYIKSKISTSYLDIPVELRFRIKPDIRGKNFWFAPGFRTGILLSDFWKFKSDNINGNNSVHKTKVYNIPNIESFHYGISLRAGYYKFGVFAYYSLTDLFEKGKGTELTPFSIGICLTPL